MSKRQKRLLAPIVAMMFINLACFSSYRISTTQLETMQTGFEAEEVYVIVDGCGEESATARPLRLAQADDDIPEEINPYEDGIDPDTGCPVVRVSPTSPVSVVTNSGSSHRITPFNFTLGNTQLISPDYDLLLPRADLAGAEVDVFSTGKTLGLIAAGVAVAVGSFVAIMLIAPPERGLGGS